MGQDPAKPLERQALLMIKGQPTHITAESACQGQAALLCPPHTHGTARPWIITGGILIEEISLELWHTHELLDLCQICKTMYLSMKFEPVVSYRLLNKNMYRYRLFFSQLHNKFYGLH